VFDDGHGLARIPASGGALERVTQLAPGEALHSVPQFLPDSKHFLYFISSRDPNILGTYSGSLDQRGSGRTF
jgi:hypothetical protein